jgi:hypothetical protein
VVVRIDEAGPDPGPRTPDPGPRTPDPEDGVGAVQLSTMSSRTRSMSRPDVREPASTRRRTKPLVIAFCVAVVFAGLIVGIIYVNHLVDQRSCHNYADKVVAAMGDGLSTPAPSTTGLDAATAQAVRNSRANYKKQLAAIDPALPVAQRAERQAELKAIWPKYVAHTKAYIEKTHGCAS